MEFNFKVLNDKVMNIEENLFNILDDNSEISSELLDDLKNIIFKKREDEQLKVAFCGQYSAGKSTMISALTGLKNIKIGQGVTTEDVTEYNFNGFSIVDTPGIKAGREDHDKKSLEYIEKADLLVYVITADGFSDVLMKNFKKMAFEDNYINKMMLVINKKSLENEENKENWLKDLKSSFDKEVYDNLKISVIDAETYLESLTEDDVEITKELLDYSNFNNFKLNLNNYVNGKGLHGKIISRINVIQSFINRFSTELSEEIEIDTLKEKIKFLKDKETEINKFFNETILEMKREVISIKNSFKGEIYLENIDNLEAETKKIELSLEYYLEGLNNKIENYTKSIIEEINIKVDEIENDYLQKIQFINLNIENNLKNYKTVKNTVGMTSQICGSIGTSVAQNFKKSDLNTLSNLFNVKISWWRKGKAVDKVKFLGKGIAAMGLALECYNQYKESELNSEIIKIKDEVESEFNAIIDNIKNNVLNILNGEDNFLHEIKGAINSLEDEKRNLIEVSKKNKDCLEAIGKIDIKCNEILDTLN